MQQAEQASARQGTDDSGDQITNDFLAFPFYDQACALKIVFGIRLQLAMREWNQDGGFSGNQLRRGPP